MNAGESVRLVLVCLGRVAPIVLVLDFCVRKTRGLPPTFKDRERGQFEGYLCRAQHVVILCFANNEKMSPRAINPSLIHHSENRMKEKSPLTPEAQIFLKVFVVAGCVWTFVKLAGKIRKGGTDEIDNQILRALRRPENSAIPLGPDWLPEVARDVTALGSGVDLRWLPPFWWIPMPASKIPCSGVFNCLSGQRLAALSVSQRLLRPAATDGGRSLDSLRPGKLSERAFHGLAIVYLTLGGFISRQVRGWVAKVYFLSVALVSRCWSVSAVFISECIIRAMCSPAGRPGRFGRVSVRRPHAGSSVKVLSNRRQRRLFYRAGV